MTSLTEVAQNALVFRDVPEDQVAPLLARGHLKESGRGASIHLQGERAHSMFIVVDGWIKLYRMSPCGSEAVVGILSRGDCFGQGAAIRGRALDAKSLGVAHQAKNREAADASGYIEPHLWTGIGRARSGCMCWFADRQL